MQRRANAIFVCPRYEKQYNQSPDRQVLHESKPSLGSNSVYNLEPDNVLSAELHTSLRWPERVHMQLAAFFTIH